eukprot:gene7798-12272_t
MNATSTLFLFVLFFFIQVNSRITEIRDDIPIWPYPKSYKDTKDGKTLSMNKNHLTFTFLNTQELPEDIENHPEIKEGVIRYKKRMFREKRKNSYQQTENSKKSLDSITEIQVLIYDYDETSLNLGVSEQHEILIPSAKNPSKIEIKAENVWGFLRALESLTQLMVPIKDTDSVQIHNTPIQIVDEPRFPWRGIMIDPARHFLTKETIYRIIDSLEYAKLNVLHIHWLDSQSFPIVIQNYEKLHEKGAYCPSCIYNEKQLNEFVQYARLRGIRIVPEFDMPGHAYSWGHGYPEITSKCPSMYWNYNLIPLNPASNLTYEVVEGVLKAMKQPFVDKFVHLGGDEVQPGCWLEDQRVKEYMDKHGLTVHTIQIEFWERVRKMYQGLKKSMVCWQELAEFPDYKLPDDTIVQVWVNGSERMKPIIEKGYKTILSDGWYLDRQEPVDGIVSWLRQDTWRHMYEVEPFKIDNWTDDQKKQILGGEGCMWGEGVDDTQIDSVIWPRSAGFAERLWSPEEINSAKIAEKRYIHFRCHVLRKNGIKAGPVRPDFCPYVYEEELVKTVAETNPSDTLVAVSTSLGLFIVAIYAGLVTIVAIAAGYFVITYRNKYLNMKEVWVKDSFAEDEILISHK